MNIKFLYTRQLEQKTYIDYYLKYLLPLSKYRVVCFFQCNNSDSETGEYEVYDIKKNSPIVKKQLKEIYYMNQPFELTETEIGFFNTQTLSLWILDVMNSRIADTQLQMPSSQFKNFLANNLNEDGILVYFDHCLKYKYYQSMQLLITAEQLNVFQNIDGTCNDNYFASWANEEKEFRQCGECIIVEKNQLIFDELSNSKFILICKQVFFDEDFQFYLWNPRQSKHTFINVKQQLNVTIIKSFDNQNQIIIKEEQPNLCFTSQRILITANPNNQAHPIIINIEFDQNLHLKDFNYSVFQIDPKGCILIETPWLIGHELICHYYSNQNVSIAICDINHQFDTFKIINFKQDLKISTFYFSQQPKHFIELFDDPSKNKVDEEIILPNQTQEITQYIQHSFLPLSIYYFHYLIQKGIYNQIGDACYDIVNLAMAQQIKREKIEN